MSNKMRKKLLSLLLILGISCFQQGCWSMKELNTTAFVLATGIDRTKTGKMLLTVQIARPSAFSGQKATSATENNVWVVSGVGDTVMDARRDLERKVPRRIYWGHNAILLIGEDMARHNIKDAINFFNRSPVIRNTFDILVAKGKAYDVLNSHSQLETASAQAAVGLLRLGVGVEVTLKDLAVMLATKNPKNPVLPTLELTPAGIAQGPGLRENIPEAVGIQQDIAPVHAEVTITGSAAFDNYYKLVDWLDMKETRGVLWLKNQMKQGVVTFSSLHQPDKKLSVRITGSNTTVEPFYNGEEIVFDIKSEVEGDVFEDQSDEDLSKSEVIEALNQKMSEEIKKSMELAIAVAQENQIDIFEYGDKFHVKYKDAWFQKRATWDEELANATFNITVESEIRRSGLVAK